MVLNNIRILTLTSGFLSLALASIVIFGWYTNNQLLVQVHASFAPMQFNTAVGFLFCGVGLIALYLNITWLVKISGLTVCLLGLAAISQYIFNIDIGIDNFFIDPVFFTKTSHPGRMAPLTALCFSLYGFSLLFTVANRALFLGMSITVITLSVIALFGYLNKYETLYGWGNLTRMAIHTAGCFLILGIGAVAYSSYGLQRQRFDVWQLAPTAVSIMVAVLTIFSSYMIEEEAEARNKEYFSNLIDRTQDSLLERYRLYEEGLRGGLGLFYASTLVERKEWESYVRAIDLDNFLPGIKGIGYIEHVAEEDLEEYINTVRLDDMPNFVNHPKTQHPKKYIIKYIEPYEKNKEAIGLDIAFEKNRKEAAERSRDSASPALTNKIDLVQDSKKQAGFLLMIPFYENGNVPKTIMQRREYIKGWVYVPFVAPEFFSKINKVNNNQLSFTVYDGNAIDKKNTIYENVDDIGSHNMILSKKTTVNIAGQQWTILWSVNKNYQSPSSDSLGSILLILGLCFSLFLFFTIHRLIHNKNIISDIVEYRTKELREANEEMEEFSYRTSHDLRSPLVSSIGLLKIIQENIPKDDQKLVKSVQLVSSSLEKLEVLVVDILTLTRTKKSKEEEQFVSIDEVVDEALEKFSHMENFSRLVFEKSFMFDGSFLSQKNKVILIIENLLSNAIKYQDLSQANSYVRIVSYANNEHVFLEISDNGIGIPENKRDVLFGMFHRFHPKVSFGSGLGLYMIKKAVDAIGGAVEYRDNDGGCTFIVSMPLVESDNNKTGP